MEQEHNDLNIDDLLEDLHQLLEEEVPGAEPPVEKSPDLLEDLHQLLDGAAPEPELPEEPSPDLPQAEPEKRSWTETQKLPRHVAKLHKHQEEAYARWLEEQGEAPQPEEASPAHPRPEPERRSWTETQKLPRHVAKLQNNQDEAYARWLEEQGENPPPEPPPYEGEDVPLPVKKRHGLRNLILILLALSIALSAVIVFALPAQPVAPGAKSDRLQGVSTLLLAGLDPSGTRTDALILLTLDGPHRAVRMVSIPRNTLVDGPLETPWINGVYGTNGGGRTGILALMDQVERLVGFRPDGYVVIGLPALESIVDTLGGVTFDVPMEMHYTDRSQDLYIDLDAGLQKLDGEKALELVRFRSGYTDGDLGRIKVHRDFLAALIDTAAAPGQLLRAPGLYRIFRQHVQTDLTAANWLWLARTAMTANTSKVNAATLPGADTYLSGRAYYVADPTLVAETVNIYCSPYFEDIAPEQLQIRTQKD